MSMFQWILQSLQNLPWKTTLAQGQQVIQATTKDTLKVTLNNIMDTKYLLKVPRFLQAPIRVATLSTLFLALKGTKSLP